MFNDAALLVPTAERAWTVRKNVIWNEVVVAYLLALAEHTVEKHETFSINIVGLWPHWPYQRNFIHRASELSENSQDLSSAMNIEMAWYRRFRGA
jgi:hypothetical protein